ncbi:MAG: acyltransferase [Acidobacteria bacterium]|nr:MAG: acyltransferase [Acidobacteriota bacterium]
MRPGEPTTRSLRTTGAHRAPRGARVAGPRSGFRGDIEGLRAIAVMMVLLFHAGVPGTDGGFAGVDVFFVISGYLITGLLVKEATGTGRVSLVQFYARRARRLLPAASLVLAATALAAWWLLPRSARGELGTDVVGATLYVVNWVLAGREVNYLAEDSPPSLLQHYWSLSVEEQFYVVWPLLIMAVLWAARRWRLRFLRLLGVALTLVVLASLVLSVVQTASSPATAYFATTTRAWQLGTGALLVLITPSLARLPRRAAHLLAWAGLAAIGATVVVVDGGTPWPGSAALLPTLGTAAVIAAGVRAPDSPAARLLGRPPMLFLGALSYGLYLWHWPALRLLAELRPDAGLTARLAVAGLSVLLAWASLHLVENPIRFHRRLARVPRLALSYGASSMLVTAAVGAALLATAPQLDTEGRDEVLSAAVVDAGQGAEVIDAAGAIGLVDPASRTDERLRPVADPSPILTRTGAVFPDPDVATKDTSLTAEQQFCHRESGQTTVTADDECWFGDPDGDTTVALVGDSKMLQWLTALDPIGAQEGWRVKVYTKSACGFAMVAMSDDCYEYNRTLAAHLADGEHTPDIVFTSLVRAGEEELGSSLADLLRPVAAAGSRVVVIDDNPSPERDELGTDVTLYECVRDHPDDYSQCSYASGAAQSSPALRVAADLLDAPVADVGRWVCPESDRAEPSCPPVVGRALVFRQGSHLTATYVASLTPVLHHELVRLGVATTPLDEIRWRLPDTTG